jgi:hypothetical protein
MAKEKKKKKPAFERRFERRFIAQSAHNPWLVRVLGGVGAACLGAGGWAYAYGSTDNHIFAIDEKLKPVPSYLIAGGAVLTGAAIWLGTSSETPIRVGAPGIAAERGETRRMPWSAVKKITWQSGTLSLIVTGKDESGTAWTLKVPLNAHPEAVAWILKEAEARVPKVVDVEDEVLEKMPEASPHAGTRVELEPLQVVGKKCAATGKTISYEPDAKICARCERVYFKRSVPKKCKCGADLSELRTSVGQDEPDDADRDEDEDESDNDEQHEHQDEGASG